MIDLDWILGRRQKRLRSTGLSILDLNINIKNRTSLPPSSLTNYEPADIFVYTTSQF